MERFLRDGFSFSWWNFLECRLGRHGDHPIGSELCRGGGMSCPWKGLFPPHGPGELGRDTQPTARCPRVAGTPFCHPVVSQHPALVWSLSFPTAARAAGIISLQHFVMQSKELFLLPASFKALPCLLYLCSFNNLAPLPFQVQSHWSSVNNLQGLMCPFDPVFFPLLFSVCPQIALCFPSNILAVYLQNHHF